jgi:uncharacterized membrane protein YcgQ (UPF0703/DUF1980 family)
VRPTRNSPASTSPVPASPRRRAFRDDTWLQILGEIVPGSAQAVDGFIPTMSVESVTQIDKPKNTYAY